MEILLYSSLTCLMPAFSFQLPFLRFHRSRSHTPEPSLPVPHDDKTGPHYRGLDLSPTLFLCPPAAAAGYPIGYQTSTECLLVERASDDFNTQPSRASPVVTSGVVPPNTAQMLSPQGLAVLRPAHLPRTLNLANAVQSQQSLEPLYSLTTSSSQSSDAQHLTVSFVYEFQLRIQ